MVDRQVDREERKLWKEQLEVLVSCRNRENARRNRNRRKEEARSRDRTGNCTKLEEIASRLLTVEVMSLSTSFPTGLVSTSSGCGINMQQAQDKTERGRQECRCPHCEL